MQRAARTATASWQPSGHGVGARCWVHDKLAGPLDSAAIFTAMEDDGAPGDVGGRYSGRGEINVRDWLYSSSSEGSSSWLTQGTPKLQRARTDIKVMPSSSLPSRTTSRSYRIGKGLIGFFEVDARRQYVLPRVEEEEVEEDSEQGLGGSRTSRGKDKRPNERIV
jgi:hypothetical protein